MMHKLNTEQGFTLVEAMIALFILAVGIMSMYSMQISAIRGNYVSNRISLSSAWAQNQIESRLGQDMKILLQSFSPKIDGLDEIPLDGWGERQDTDKNGFDDNGVDAIPNFGLDAATLATADRSETSPDQRFTIFYNFARDVPFPGLLTIRVLVQENNSTAAPVSLTYIKSPTTTYIKRPTT